jgi:hypothetical protein
MRKEEKTAGVDTTCVLRIINKRYYLRTLSFLVNNIIRREPEPVTNKPYVWRRVIVIGHRSSYIDHT